MHHQPRRLDARLWFSLGTGAWKLASLDEHALAAGMSVDQLLEEIDGFLSSGQMTVESSNGVVFLHTAPGGRPPEGFGINLWASLRSERSPADASGRWRQIRDLELAGWRVEHRPSVLRERFGRLNNAPWCALVVRDEIVPLICNPPLPGIGMLCDRYSEAGEPMVAVICGPRLLDHYVSQVRRWTLERGAVAGGRWLSVLILEAPALSATLIRCTDNSVEPVTFARPEMTPGSQHPNPPRT